MGSTGVVYYIVKEHYIGQPWGRDPGDRYSVMSNNMIEKRENSKEWKIDVLADLGHLKGLPSMLVFCDYSGNSKPTLGELILSLRGKVAAKTNSLNGLLGVLNELEAKEKPELK
jgi:hypothetical protein